MNRWRTSSWSSRLRPPLVCIGLAGGGIREHRPLRRHTAVWDGSAGRDGCWSGCPFPPAPGLLLPVPPAPHPTSPGPSGSRRARSAQTRLPGTGRATADAALAWALSRLVEKRSEARSERLRSTSASPVNWSSSLWKSGHDLFGRQLLQMRADQLDRQRMIAQHVQQRSPGCLSRNASSSNDVSCLRSTWASRYKLSGRARPASSMRRTPGKPDSRGRQVMSKRP